ncbi:MAG: type II toxin-antitoxin system RelB/DinJ family antitoxin [Synergistaceae bacterium]|jgi:DNA-damage-inducible protein J|nr:type II toxin-antitoxin system RelB/DinJ family antitoxin [Synergistaceae bacterium]
MNGEMANINFRMDKALKEQAEVLFSELGMNMTTALNVFVRQAVRQGKIPFEISLARPNAETLAGTVPKQSSSAADFAKETGVPL